MAPADQSNADPLLGNAAGELPASLPDYAYQKLLQAILSGQLRRGAPVRQEKVSAELGMSRLPVREALRRLDAEGLVVLRPRRGYFVAALDTKEIAELFEIRSMLEKKAGYFAALNRTEQDLVELKEVLTALDKTAKRKPLDVSAFYEGNRRFHQRLFACSKRVHFCRVLLSIHDSLTPYIRMSANLKSVAAAQQDHWELFNAVAAGDAKLVARLCESHCQNSYTRLMRSMPAEQS